MKKIIKLSLIMVIVLSLLPISALAASETTEADDTPVLCSTITSLDDLQYKIDSNVGYSSQDTINTPWKGSATPHKIVVEEEGWLFIKVFNEQGDVDCFLYSNKDATSYLSTVKLNVDTNAVLACYVQPGDYYYQIKRWNGYEETTTTTCYVGLLPSSNRISVKSIKYNSDKTSATVTFDYDQDYLTSFTTGTIRIANGAVSHRKIYDATTWKTASRENALPKNTFTVKENGTYTARIAGIDNYYCAVTFEVTDLKSSAPKAPKITTMKSETEKISGTGTAGAKVYVSVGGNTYSKTIDKNGKWNITTTSTLKIGTIIKAYVKNSKGVKSKSTTVIVSK